MLGLFALKFESRDYFAAWRHPCTLLWAHLLSITHALGQRFIVASSWLEDYLFKVSYSTPKTTGGGADFTLLRQVMDKI